MMHSEQPIKLHLLSDQFHLSTVHEHIMYIVMYMYACMPIFIGYNACVSKVYLVILFMC